MDKFVFYYANLYERHPERSEGSPECDSENDHYHPIPVL